MVYILANTETLQSRIPPSLHLSIECMQIILNSLNPRLSEIQQHKGELMALQENYFPQTIKGYFTYLEGFSVDTYQAS